MAPHHPAFVNIATWFPHADAKADRLACTLLLLLGIGMLTALVVAILTSLRDGMPPNNEREADGED